MNRLGALMVVAGAVSLFGMGAAVERHRHPIVPVGQVHATATSTDDGDIVYTWDNKEERRFEHGVGSTCLLACSRVWRQQSEAFPRAEQRFLWDYALACSDRCEGKP